MLQPESNIPQPNHGTESNIRNLASPYQEIIGLDQPLSRDKVKGMLLGVVIGDALGMPVETLSKNEIAAKFGRITEYRANSGHKWFSDSPAGQWTDDTQLTLAVMQSLVDCRKLDLENLSQCHVEALNDTDRGWGGTTRRAVRRLAAGAPFHESGRPERESDGKGNGVIMKIAPLAALLLSERNRDEKLALEDIVRVNNMTHNTPIAQGAAIGHVIGLMYCLANRAESFSIENLTRILERYVRPFDEGLASRLARLPASNSMSIDEIILQSGGGTTFVGDSMAQSYLLFGRNWRSIEALYDAVNAGGDTDSNASIVGALLGAIHGTQIFPDWLRNGFQQQSSIEEAIGRFCDLVAPQ